jgi:hypothetical protein
MTLISSFYIGKTPCLLSDCLISRQALPNIRSNLPLLGQIAPNLDRDPTLKVNFPTGLRQKIVLCGQNLAIAWAGKVSVAEKIVTEIYERHHDSPFAVEELNAYARSLPANTWQELSLIGQLHHDESRSFNFWWGADAIALPSTRFRRIVTAGTGARSLHSALQAFEESVGGAPRVHHPISIALGVAGQFMATELVSPDITLGSSFGINRCWI